VPKAFKVFEHDVALVLKANFWDAKNFTIDGGVSNPIKNFLVKFLSMKLLHRYLKLIEHARAGNDL